MLRHVTSVSKICYEKYCTWKSLPGTVTNKTVTHKNCEQPRRFRLDTCDYLFSNRGMNKSNWIQRVQFKWQSLTNGQALIFLAHLIFMLQRNRNRRRQHSGGTKPTAQTCKANSHRIVSYPIDSSSSSVYQLDFRQRIDSLTQRVFGVAVGFQDFLCFRLWHRCRSVLTPIKTLSKKLWLDQSTECSSNMLWQDEFACRETKRKKNFAIGVLSLCSWSHLVLRDSDICTWNPINKLLRTWITSKWHEWIDLAASKSKQIQWRYYSFQEEHRYHANNCRICSYGQDWWFHTILVTSIRLPFLSSAQA